MRHLLTTLTALCLASGLFAGTVTYTADDNTIFANPERGFITMLTGHLSTQHKYAVKGSESTLRNKQSSEKMSIVLVHYYLDNYVSTATIPSTVLNAFDEDMQVLRNLGMKAIIRFSYADGTYGSGKNESAHDAPLNIVKQHLAQYKSHWQANSDVIFVFQAGLIGAWGEWYYSDNFGNKTSTINTSRRALLDTLLQTVPADRCVQIRTPLFKTGYIGSTAPLTRSEAYQNTPKARIAHHNDAFLENYGDMGTYEDTATQKPYIAQETLYVPIGGESCILDDAVATTNASYEKTIAEMSRLHWTFIQSGYSTVVTDKWRQNGTFDELNRRMGYRLQLVSGTYSNQVAQGGKLSVNLSIRNTGFAPLYNERKAYIVLKSGSNTYPIALSSDPRAWLPNGAVSTVNEQLTIPSSVPTGTYQLYLHLPDLYPSLASNPAYAIRLANTGLWDATTGMNALNASVVVTAGGDDPQPIDPEGDAVVLPATLNKANVSAYSDDMSWYNTDYFDFGPEDEENVGRWAEWQVELRYPGNYIVSTTGNYPNGHQWQLSLTNTTAMYQLPETWDQGEVTETGAAVWNLGSLSQGIYILRVQNIMEWGRPKLKSITLSYDGELPTDIEKTNTPSHPSGAKKVLVDGRLLILQGGKMYTPDGQEVK